MATESRGIRATRKQNMKDEMTARKMQNLSAKARWAKLSPEQRSAWMSKVRSAGKLKKEEKNDKSS